MHVTCVVLVSLAFALQTSSFGLVSLAIMTPSLTKAFDVSTAVIVAVAVVPVIAVRPACTLAEAGHCTTSQLVRVLAPLLVFCRRRFVDDVSSAPMPMRSRHATPFLALRALADERDRLTDDMDTFVVTNEAVVTSPR